MAWGERLVVLLLVVVVVVVDGFNSTKFGQTSSSLALWVYDDEDGVLRKMNLLWENKQLFLVPLYHDMLDFVGDIFRSRKHTFGNVSSMEMSDDDDTGDGTQEDFPFGAVANNREHNARVEVPVATVGVRASNPADLMPGKILRQMRRRSERRKERRRRRRIARQNHTNPWISESTHQAPIFGILLSLGWSPSEMGRTLTSVGPLWPDVMGSRGIGPSLLSTEDFRVINGSNVRRNNYWKSYGDSPKKPVVVLKEGQMHGKERMTDRKKGERKNRAEKPLKRKKDRNRILQTELVLQVSQQQ